VNTFGAQRPIDEQPDGFALTLATDSAAPGTARDRVNDLADLLPPLILADLRTVLTELVINCIQHGTGDPIGVIVDVYPSGFVRGWVGDGGPESPAIEEGGHEGLGLLIVEALVSAWGTERDSSDVWFELAAPTG
jgi:anti-sigma regulatory factor (Ser/Thr protein kinase)